MKKAKSFSRFVVRVMVLILVIAGLGLFGLRQMPHNLAEAQAQTTAPRIFYTDIISGPNTGGRNNNGAFLTISGKGFGSTRGSSTVIVGGGEVIDYITWSDTKIEVQLGPNTRTGSVVVSTANGSGTSPEQFTIRPGNIYFMSLSGNDANPGTFEQPWRTFGETLYYNNVGKLRSGDFLYVKEGNYQTAPGYYTISLRTRHNGEQGNPVTFAAYPSERVFISSNNPSNNGIIFVRFNTSDGPLHDFVFAGFHIDANQGFVIRGNNVRIVNNECWRGNRYGVIEIDVRSDNLVILGNTVHDSCPTYKLYHAIYIGVPSDNVLIAHNTIYNIGTTDGGRGVQVYWAPEQPGDPIEYFDNIVVRDNLFYNIGRDAILISGYTRSAKVYNNVVYRAGFVDYGGIRVNNWAVPSQVEVYNNTIYDSANNTEGYGSLVINNHDQLYLRNNIVYSTGVPYDFVGEGGTTAGITASNNLYFGAGAPPSWDSGSLNVDPRFVDLANRDFHLQETSPAIDAGFDTGILTDYNGNPRPQGPGYDIGAYEYISPTLRGDVNGDGLVNVVDVQLAVNQFLGVQPQTQEADLNGDGVVNVIDVQQLVNIILSLAT